MSTGQREPLQRGEPGESFVADVSVVKFLPGVALWATGLFYGVVEGGVGGYTIALGSCAFLALTLAALLARQPALVIGDSGVSVRGIWLGWDEIDRVDTYSAPLPWFTVRVLLFHADPNTLLQRDPVRWRRWFRRKRRNPMARDAVGLPLMFLNRSRKEVIRAVEQRLPSAARASP